LIIIVLFGEECWSWINSRLQLLFGVMDTYNYFHQTSLHSHYIHHISWLPASILHWNKA
jgi:hypothetical protein